MTLNHLEIKSGQSQSQPPDEGTRRKGLWPVTSGYLLIGFLATSAFLPISGIALFRHAQSIDPSLSTSSVELLWALMTYIPARLVRFVSLPGEIHAVLLPTVFVAIGVPCALAGRLDRPNLFSLFLLYWAFTIGSFSQGFLQLTGADALVLGSLVIIHSRWIESGGVISKMGWLWIGILSGSGWVFAVVVSFILGFAKPKWKSSILFVGLGFVLNLLGFLLFRTRYPQPDLVTTTSPTSEFIQTWFGADGLIGWSEEFSWIGTITEFAGFYGFLLFLLTGLTVWVLKTVWSLSEGRTVSFQMILYSFAFIPLAIMIWTPFVKADEETEHVSVESLSKNLRTLGAKVPSHTHLVLDAESFGVIQYLSTQEVIGKPIQINLRQSHGKPSTEDFEQTSAERVKFRPQVTVEYNGENVVWVEGEPLLFEPQYLLDATTEVWAATPDFFVANNPTELTDQPVIRFEGRPLAVGFEVEPRIRDWNYNGERIFLYRSRLTHPWTFPQGEWKLDYTGYILSSEFEKWGGTVRPLHRTTLRSFF